MIHPVGYTQEYIDMGGRMYVLWLMYVWACIVWPHYVVGNPHAKKLYEVLLRKSGYNRIVRPVQNESEVIVVTIGLKLSQLIDVVSDDQLFSCFLSTIS